MTFYVIVPREHNLGPSLMEAQWIHGAIQVRPTRESAEQAIIDEYPWDRRDDFRIEPIEIYTLWHKPTIHIQAPPGVSVRVSEPEQEET